MPLHLGKIAYVGGNENNENNYTPYIFLLCIYLARAKEVFALSERQKAGTNKIFEVGHILSNRSNSND